MNRLWARYILGAAAVLFAIAAVGVHFWKVGTSVTVVAGSQPATVQTTTVNSAGSDALQLGLAGFAAVLALAAVFSDRLSSITLPGGIGISLSPEQKQAASEAVARRAHVRAVQPVAAAAADPAALPQLLRAQPLMLQLAVMAAVPAAGPPGQVVDATEGAVRQAAQAAQRTTDYAETLLRLAKVSPDGLRATAQAWGIPEAQWSQVMMGDIPRDLWDTLADRALNEVA